MIIGAYVKVAGEFDEHTQVLPEKTKSDPVKVEFIDTIGAHLEGEIPPGEYHLYDLVTFVETRYYEPIYTGWGFTEDGLPIRIPSHDESEEPKIVEGVRRVIQTYAVSVVE